MCLSVGMRMCVQRPKENTAGLELMDATTTGLFYLKIVLCGAVFCCVVTGPPPLCVRLLVSAQAHAHPESSLFEFVCLSAQA